MKVLQVCGHFRLPDDFSGSLADALRAMADYHETTGANNPDRIVRDGKEANTLNMTLADNWKLFWDKTATGKFRLYMVMGVQELDTKTNTMRLLDTPQ